MRIVNGLYVTECISFPRSGSKWLSTMLKRYFGERMKYCEMYIDPRHTIDIDEETNYQKNHDFKLDTPTRDDRKYIVQVREFEACCISYYRLLHLHFATGTDKPGAKPFVDTDTSDYQQFRRDTKALYDLFLAKWVFAAVPNSHLVIYDRLLAATEEEVANVIQFVCPDEIDMVRLSNCFRDQSAEASGLVG